MGKKPLFSICLIGRNEEKTLPRLLSSLSEFMKRWWEVILVDTWSTDNTAQVARDQWAKVTEVWDRFLVKIDKTTEEKINDRFVVEWEQKVINEWDVLFDFSAARNYAATLCSNDMIATPDCDEIYTKLDIDEINNNIRVNWIDQFTYEFVYSHNEDGSPSLQFTHSKFYNRKKLERKWIIHEVLHTDQKHKQLYLWEDVIKLEHYQNPETNRDKYLTWLAYDCFLNPDNDRNSHYLGREFMYKWRYRSAIKELKRHIDMNARVTERAESMKYIWDCLLYLWEDQEALWRYVRSLDTEPRRREPLIALSQYYYRKHNHLLCAAYAQAALQLPWTSYYSNYVPNYREIPHELLYRAYRYLWDKSQSKQHYDLAVQYNPTKEKYKQDRSFFYPDQ